jgi:hypothetical protein
VAFALGPSIMKTRAVSISRAMANFPAGCFFSCFFLLINQSSCACKIAAQSRYFEQSHGQPLLIPGERQSERGKWIGLYDFGHCAIFFGKSLGIQIFFIFNLAFLFANRLNLPASTDF